MCGVKPLLQVTRQEEEMQAKRRMSSRRPGEKRRQRRRTPRAGAETRAGTGRPGAWLGAAEGGPPCPVGLTAPFRLPAADREGPAAGAAAEAGENGLYAEAEEMRVRLAAKEAGAGGDPARWRARPGRREGKTEASGAAGRTEEDGPADAVSKALRGCPLVVPSPLTLSLQTCEVHLMPCVPTVD